ncbi:unnamed protein product, partial [Ectocarpus sp. 12 AP-2014]
SVAADGERAAVGPSKTEGEGRGGGGGGERPESGGADAGGAAGDAERPAAATESRDQSSTAPTATLSAATVRQGGEPFNNEQGQAGTGATTGTGIEVPGVEGDAPEEPGAADESAKTKDAALAGSVPRSSEGAGGVEEVGAPAAAVGSTPNKGTATAAFDMEEVRSDQRFEQLVEIIECVAKDLSVSDTSKVVWGLSILGHVPRNSLLESLASFLTDRLRQEAAAAAASSAAEDIGGNPGEGEGGANGEKVTVTGGTEDGISSPSSSDSPQERGLGSGSGTPAEGRDDGQFSGVEGGNAGGGGGGGGGGADAVDKATTGAASAKKEVAAACTSGTDLATAALSFAYAHAR